MTATDERLMHVANRRRTAKAAQSQIMRDKRRGNRIINGKKCQVGRQFAGKVQRLENAQMRRKAQKEKEQKGKGE